MSIGYSKIIANGTEWRWNERINLLQKRERIKGFEVIGLTETWMSEKQKGRVEKLLKDYKIKTVKAWREKRRGRMKGGMLLAVKKKAVKEMEWMDGIENSKELVGVRIKSEKENVRIILTYMREEREQLEKDRGGSGENR